MKKQIFYITLFLISASLFAQTTNSGEMYISEGTQFSTIQNFNNLTTASFISDGEAFIYANFNNDGVVDYIGDTGYTRFQGNAVQEISGGNTSYFYDVLFYNNVSDVASFELSNQLSIAGEAEFNEGIVKSDDFGGLVIFENNAEHLGAYHGSHVDGYVQKVGNTSFLYPIGDAGFYRFAAISAPNDLDDVFTSKYYFEDTNINYPTTNLTNGLVLVDNTEYWTITRENGNSNVVLTLSWEDTTTPFEILDNTLEAITIAYWDPVLSVWVNQPSVVDEDNQTVTTITQIENYGVYTLARVESEIDTPCGFTIVNTLITPDGDGLNDYFDIDYVDNGCISNVNVKIFNRWGVKVFEDNNYDENGTNVFNGYSNGRLTLNDNEKLPSGTYFYVLDVQFNDIGGNKDSFQKTDFIYINGN